MKKYAIIALSLLIISCAQQEGTEAKKKQLESLKKQAAELASQIEQLELELSEEDSTVEFLVSVSVDTLDYREFSSQSEFQATVESDQNVMVSAENGGLVTQILVREGQSVSAGQLLVTLDASLIETQIEEINKALEFAENVFNKQQSLRDQNIGTEMQYLEAKNRFESLQKQKNSALARLSKFHIKAPFSGKIDDVSVNVGALIGPGSPLLRLVDDGNIKVVAQVPESYIGKIKKGDKVLVKYPGINSSSIETVDAVSRVINADNRTFLVFIRPTNKDIMLKPNLLAIVSATDFKADSVITVPTQIIKRDAKNNPYVFVAKMIDNNLVVEKRAIEVSKYGTELSIVSKGLEASELVIIKGYNSVDVGDKVKTN